MLQKMLRHAGFAARLSGQPVTVGSIASTIRRPIALSLPRTSSPINLMSGSNMVKLNGRLPVILVRSSSDNGAAKLMYGGIQVDGLVEFQTKLSADKARDYKADADPQAEEVELGWRAGVRISDDESEIVNDGEVVVRSQSMSYIIDYPLLKPITCTVTADTAQGITRGALCRAVQNEYYRIYSEEWEAGEAAQQNQASNKEEPNLPYGIWGHGIEDLSLMSAFLPKGETLWKLSVDS